MSFSLNACYAALKTVKAQNVDEAFNVMIIALIESKRYQQINIVDIIQDFNDKFGFQFLIFQ